MKKFELKSTKLAVYWDGDVATPYYTIFEGENKYIPDRYIRVSEFIDVTFSPLSQEELVKAQLDSLSAKEKEILAELHQKLEEIRSQRRQLLALTHQPEENAHEQETDIRADTEGADDIVF